MDLSKYFNEKFPVAAPLAGFPGVHLNKSTIKENLYNSSIQTDSLIRINDHFNPDILFTFMDLAVEAYALGAPVINNDMESSTVKEYIIDNPSDLDNIKNTFSSDNDRVKVFTETVKNLKEKYPEKPVAAYVSGPFTLAGLLMGANNIALNTVLKKDFVIKSLELTTEVIKQYSNALINAGADMIVVLEPSAVMLSPEMFREFSGIWVKDLTQSLNTELILHICGNTEHLIEPMCETGAAGLSLDAAVDLPAISSRIPEKTYIIGNIDPVGVMCEKSPKEIKQDTMALKTAMKDYSNFIVSTGCDLPPETPAENITAFMEAGKTIY